MCAFDVSKIEGVLPYAYAGYLRATNLLINIIHIYIYITCMCVGVCLWYNN